jgi:hypothetical protein
MLTPLGGGGGTWAPFYIWHDNMFGDDLDLQFPRGRRALAPLPVSSFGTSICLETTSIQNSQLEKLTWLNVNSKLEPPPPRQEVRVHHHCRC